MQTRPLTPKELLASLRSSIESVRVHCERFRAEVETAQALPQPTARRPEYDLGPISDMSAQLRKLLGKGQGDNLLRRAAAEVGVPMPEISTAVEAAAPTTRYPTIVQSSFALGSLPDGAGGTSIPFHDVLDLNCIAIVHDEQPAELVSWRSLIQTMADKDGVHLDAGRPKIWDAINQYDIGIVPAIPFAIYRMSVAVLEAGNEILAHAGLDPVEAPPLAIAGLICQAVIFTETRQGKIPLRNLMCPCGSGKKFKVCCGSVAIKR